MKRSGMRTVYRLAILSYTFSRLYVKIQRLNKYFVYLYHLEERERGNVRTTLTRAKEGIIHKSGKVNSLPYFIFIMDKNISNIEISKLFKTSFFWDYQIENLDLKNDAIIVIERVLSQSLNLERDYPKLLNIYTSDFIKKIFENSVQIFGNERIEKISSFLNINPQNIQNYFIERLEYNGYFGTVQFSQKDNCFFGKIIGINDLVLYESEKIIDLEKSFKDAVLDYSKPL